MRGGSRYARFQSGGNLLPFATKPPAAAVNAGAAKAGSSAIDALYKTGLKQTGVVLLLLCAVLALTAVVVYIVGKVRQTQLQRVALHTALIQMDSTGQVPYKVDATKMALVNAGHEFSYSTWLYLGGAYQATAGHKLLLQRGTLPATGLDRIDSGTNPVLFLDKATNRLYVAVATNRVTAAAPMALDDVLKKDKDGKYASGFLVTYVDYVPLQRWVNVTVTVRDNSVYVHVDGDMYSVVSVNDISPGVAASGARAIIRGTAGDLTIGHRSNNTAGYVANSGVWNYALTQREIQAVYRNGPYRKSYLSSLGLGNYGLRSPVYSLDTAAAAGTTVTAA